MAAQPTKEMAAILKQVADENLPPWEDYPHAEARRLSVERNAYWNARSTRMTASAAGWPMPAGSG
jgi:hypothetical protein